MDLKNNPKLKQLKTKLDTSPLPDVTRLQPPKFWKHGGPLSFILRELLLPFSVLYYSGFLFNKSRIKPQRLSVPVWCVGNIVVGGTGKTPFAIHLAKELQALGKNPAFVTRGFGGLVSEDVIKVDTAVHTHNEVGDEPLLLARTAPCYVAAKRVLGGQAAIAAGHDILILDDGFQHHAIHKDVSFLLIDGTYGFGNHGILPGGPLREPPHKAMAAAQAIVMVGEDQTGVFKKYPQTESKPIIRTNLKPPQDWSKANEALKDKKLFAFAGIGNPSKFYDSLRKQGMAVVGTQDFPDHYRYVSLELDGLLRKAIAKEAELITTEKDFVRLPESFRDKVHVLPIEMVPADTEAFTNLVKKFL